MRVTQACKDGHEATGKDGAHRCITGRKADEHERTTPALRRRCIDGERPARHDRRQPGAGAAVLVEPGAAGRRGAGDARQRAGGLRKTRHLFAPGAGAVRHPHQGRSGSRQRHDRADRRAARRFLQLSRHPDGPFGGRRLNGQPELPRARQARRRRAEIHSMDAGDLRDGRQQAGAGAPARGRRHQRHHLRAARRLGQGARRGYGVPKNRLSRRAEGADAPLLPGLSLPLLHRRGGDEVQVRRGGADVDRLPRPLAIRHARLDQLRLHAGAPCSPARCGWRGTMSPG